MSLTTSEKQVICRSLTFEIPKFRNPFVISSSAVDAGEPVDVAVSEIIPVEK